MTRPPMAPVVGLSRTASLPSPPSRPRPEPTPAPESTAKLPRHDEPASPAVARPSGSASKASRPRSDSAVTMRAITLSLPAALIQQVRAKAREEGISQPDVLMDALVAAQDRLPDLLAHDGQRRPTHSDGLFLRQPAPAPATGEPLGTLTLRMLSPNVEAIDDLARVHAAPSRSALCATALRNYLRR